MFAPRSAQVRIQLDTINKLIDLLETLRSYISSGRLLLSKEELDELVASSEGMEELIDTIIWANYDLRDPPSPGR